MKTLFAAIACLFANVVFAQTVIRLRDVPNHIGDTVKVCGKVYSSHYLPEATGKPTFLSIGAEYPNQYLSVLIWGKDRKAMNLKPETEVVEKVVCIIGKIELYRSRLLIVVSDPAQLCSRCSE